MAIAIESFTTNTVLVNATIVLTKPSEIQVGDTLLIQVVNDDSSSNDQWTNNLTGWTLIGEAGTSNTDSHIAAFWRIADGTEGSTISVVATGALDTCGWYVRISGAHATAPIDVSNFAVDPSPTPTHPIPAVTTTVDNCLAIYGLGFDGGDGFPFSEPSGWSELDEQRSGASATDSAGVIGSKAIPTAGTTGTATVGSAVSDGAAYYMIAIAPAVDNDVDALMMVGGL